MFLTFLLDSSFGEWEYIVYDIDASLDNKEKIELYKGIIIFNSLFYFYIFGSYEIKTWY